MVLTFDIRNGKHKYRQLDLQVPDIISSNKRLKDTPINTLPAIRIDHCYLLHHIRT